MFWSENDRLKKDFGGLAALLPSHLGTLTISMPNVYFLEGKTADHIRSLCKTSTLNEVLNSRNW